jgi:hypothetical protein
LSIAALNTLSMIAMGEILQTFCLFYLANSAGMTTGSDTFIFGGGR